jgi:hypothetical protein
MLARLSFAIVVLIAHGAQQTVGASPITYDFTGTFGGQAVNGVSQFNGSFTINGDPTVSSSGSVNESGSDVSVTVNMGGQLFNFVNQQNPDVVATFIAGELPTWIANPTGLPQDQAFVYGATQSGNPIITFGMSFYSPAAADQLANLRNFSFPTGTSSVYVTDTSGTSYQWAEGSITSIDLVSTPEPSTLAVFAVLGIAAMVHRRQRRRQA